MASEIIVQTLKGPSSGANANKVIVPSGQTLDVSGGALVPSAGQIVQMVTKTDTSSSGTSSTSFVASGLFINITPKFSNSIIEVTLTSTSYINAAGSSGAFVWYRDGASLDNVSHTQIGLASAANMYVPSAWSVIDAPASTSSLRYELYYKTNSGSVYVPPGSADCSQLKAVEIAQ